MKFVSIIFVALFVSVAEGKNLRAADDTQVRRLESDTTAINNAVATTTGLINSGVQAGLPASISLGQTFSSSVTADAACGDIDITLDLTDVKGLNTLALKKLTVANDGNKTYTSTSCATADFEGNFNYEFGVDSLTVTGAVAFEDTTGGCGNFSSGLDAIVADLKVSGLMFLKGNIAANAAVITGADLLSIQTKVGSITPDYTATTISDDFKNATDEIVLLLNKELKPILENKINDAIAAGLAALKGARVELGLGGGLPLIAALYQAEIQRSIDDAVSGTQAQIAAINQRVNNQITAITGPVAALVQGIEASTTNTVNSFTSAVSNQVASWGSSTNSYIGRLGFVVDEP